MQIAIVDDSGFSRMQLKKKLTEIDETAQVTEYSDGLKAVESISKGQYDLVTMDLTMPNMDGVQAIRKLREKGVNTPVFVLSADIQDASRKRCAEAGCSGFIAKPFDDEDLKAMLLACRHERNR